MIDSTSSDFYLSPFSPFFKSFDVVFIKMLSGGGKMLSSTSSSNSSKNDLDVGIVPLRAISSCYYSEHMNAIVDSLSMLWSQQLTNWLGSRPIYCLYTSSSVSFIISWFFVSSYG